MTAFSRPLAQAPTAFNDAGRRPLVIGRVAAVITRVSGSYAPLPGGCSAARVLRGGASSWEPSWSSASTAQGIRDLCQKLNHL